MYQKIINILKNKLEARRVKQDFNRNAALKSVYARFKGHPEGKWIVGKADAVLLYTLMKKYQPKNVLDLGTGIGASTAVIALALEAGAKITTVEQYEKCIRIAKELIPESFQAKINFVHSDTYAMKHDAISKYLYLSGYQQLPVQYAPFDFVLVDGPGAWLEQGKLVSLPNGDIVNLLPHLVSGCKVYIDGRKQNTDLYKRFLSKYLRFVEQIGHNAVFERTDIPLKNLSAIEVIDVKLAGRKGSSYFEHV